MPARDPTRRRRILEVARRHFLDGGYRGVRLDAIAREAGCAKGALYLEFADKEALLRAVVEDSFDAVRARFVADVLGIESPLGRLAETLRFAYREFQREPLFGRLLRDDPELRALGVPSGDDVSAARAQVELLAGWVDEGIARGEIRADVDRDIVPYAIGVLRFAPMHLAMAETLGLMSRERALAGLVELFVAGLAARPAEATTLAAARTTTATPAIPEAPATAKKTPAKRPAAKKAPPKPPPRPTPKPTPKPTAKTTKKTPAKPAKTRRTRPPTKEKRR
ncbi:MAG: TetR/AcrR family transcriptional regulator [Nannocystaceae bacterium]